MENPEDKLSMDLYIPDNDSEPTVNLIKSDSNNDTAITSKARGKLLENNCRRQEDKRVKLAEEQQKIAEVIRKFGEEAQRQDEK